LSAKLIVESFDKSGLASLFEYDSQRNLIFFDKKVHMLLWILIETKKTGLPIKIQNPILTLDCQSHSNPLNWIAIRIEQSSDPIQQYPGNIIVSSSIRRLKN